MKDEVVVDVPPYLFDGMRFMTFPINVNEETKTIHVDLMAEYGTNIMGSIVEKSREKYPGFDVNISK